MNEDKTEYEMAARVGSNSNTHEAVWLREELSRLGFRWASGHVANDPTAPVPSSPAPEQSGPVTCYFYVDVLDRILMVGWTAPEGAVFTPETLVARLRASLPSPNTDTDTDTDDPVNHPPHYTSHPSGVECIDITRHHNFCIGNAIKYLWRSGLKGGASKGVEDLKKAVFYIEEEIAALDPDYTPSRLRKD